jgi:hypothetical protein
MTSRYGDVYRRALARSVSRSASVNWTRYGLVLGMSRCPSPEEQRATAEPESSSIIRHRIYELEYLDQVTGTLFGWWLQRDSNPRVGLERADTASQSVDVLRWLFRIIACPVIIGLGIREHGRPLEYWGSLRLMLIA